MRDFRVYEKETNEITTFSNFCSISNFTNETRNEKMSYFINKYKNCIFLESTGLKDKNGVEIFNGDIIEWKRTSSVHILPLVYDKDYCCYRLGKDGIFIKPQMHKHLRVIGNIYQDKEKQ